jgi:glycogen debranching enzyme
MEQKQSKDSFIVLGTSSLTEEKTIVLKHSDVFAIFNKYGDILPHPGSAQGIYHHGTRFLSGFSLLIEGQKPLFLSSNLRERGEMFVVDLTNPDIIENHRLKLEKGITHILRKKVLWDSFFYEQIIFQNFGLEEISFNAEFGFDADFRDIFEIRGTERLKRGEKLPLKMESQRLNLGYIGIDKVERTARIHIDPVPDRMGDQHVYYNIRLLPGEKFIISSTISFIISGKKERAVLNFRKAVKKHKRWFDYIDQYSCRIITSNEQFNNWIKRSGIDLITMVTNTNHGPYPYAGIPWYDTPFGRDGIITALECLWASPEVSRGVLRYLSATQAREEDSFRDAEPGKILHETREGEMAMLNEIPFRQYYGTIDATPLFIVLAGAYYKRTADLGLIREIWESIEMALVWIDKYGDINNDMFIEYIRKEKTGLFNQGWKDSHDAITYENGEIARLPVALCEVQGYVYEAWINAALMTRALGNEKQANDLLKRAEILKEKFSETFWSENKSSFYLALANGQPCNVLSSNAGHCLFSGIATPEQAGKLARSLLSENMFTGWGIRTLSSDEVRYNPMSYHNGSVWPHDTALIAYGFSRYGLKDEVRKIALGLFDASLFSDGQRLPELFCGFDRRPGEPPTNYPVACSPQAWSVATVFIIIQALLGMEINEIDNIIRFYRPVLPAGVDRMCITNLSFRGMRVALEFVSTGDSVSVSSENKNVRIEIKY